MAKPSIVLLATVDTKTHEAKYLEGVVSERGISVQRVNIALNTDGKLLSGNDKIVRVKEVATQQARVVATLVEGGAKAVVAIGGGTGSQIALRVLRTLPATFPKVLITPLPFDPRAAVSDNRVIVIPTLCDIQGLNPTLREALNHAAAVISGLAHGEWSSAPRNKDNSVALSGLGVTNTGVINLQKELASRGHEATVFHAYGTGGAALVRWIDSGAFIGLIDFTPHELTRLRIAGYHVEMSRRFVAAVEARLPMVIVPGGLNFIGMGEYSTLSDEYKKRPIFKHSDAFTHVAVSAEEMIDQTIYLMECLSAAKTPVKVLVPMQGFSSTDCIGGELNSPELRNVFLKTARAHSSANLQVTDFPEFHIDEVGFAKICVETFIELIA